MRILAFILVIAIPAFCDSKAEIELRARLAAAQAQLAAAAKDKAALQESLEKLNADALARSEAAAVSSKAAAATATQRSATAAQQRTAARLAAGADAASAQSTADINAAASKTRSEDNADASRAETGAIREQVAEVQRDNARGRLTQLILALGGFVVLFVPVMLALVKVWEQAGIRKGDHNAVMDKIALVQAEAHYAAVVAGTAEAHAEAQEAKLDQIHVLVNSNLTTAIEEQLDARRSNLASLQEVIALHASAGTQPSPASLAAVSAARAKIAELEPQLRDRLAATLAAATAKKSASDSILKFTVEVPKEFHKRLASALSKLDQVRLDPNTGAGRAQNTDGSAMDFAIVNDTTIGITVTANPNNLTLNQMREKVVSRIAELLSKGADAK